MSYAVSIYRMEVWCKLWYDCGIGGSRDSTGEFCRIEKVLCKPHVWLLVLSGAMTASHEITFYCGHYPLKNFNGLTPASSTAHVATSSTLMVSGWLYTNVHSMVIVFKLECQLCTAYTIVLKHL